MRRHFARKMRWLENGCYTATRDLKRLDPTHRHFVLLATFFVKSQPAACAIAALRFRFRAADKFALAVELRDELSSTPDENPGHGGCPSSLRTMGSSTGAQLG